MISIKELKELHKESEFGCSDGGCPFRITKHGPGGQHTNGGCRCIDRFYGAKKKLIVEMLNPQIIERLEDGRSLALLINAIPAQSSLGKIPRCIKEAGTEYEEKWGKK